MEKKIAILHIATGRYTVFWRDFYRSFEEFFLPDCPKTFFLFTDDDSLSVDDNVVKIHQENLDWPYITLLRFEIFLKVEEQLKQFDYIYFFNVNMMAVVKIGEEVLPSSGQELALALHPYLGFQPRSRWTYDKNPYSQAYIPDHQGDYYVMGSFIGGTRGGFLRMCHVLCDNIRADLQQGIIALWHDESHLNHYILDKDPLILSSEYISVEGWPLPFKPKIVYLEKSQPRYGGHDYMRGLTDMPNHVLQAHPESLDKYIRSLYFKKTWKTLIKQFLARLLIGNDNLQVVSLSDEGLGIQMFQYAFACCLSEKGRKVIFDRCELFAHNLLRGGGESSPLSTVCGY